jgi:hypothetical protein
MAKKQTRRSLSVSRTTYERLKAFCETNNISMSQLVETRVNDFLGAGEVAPVMPSVPFRPVAPRPVVAAMPVAAQPPRLVEPRPVMSSSQGMGSMGSMASTPSVPSSPTLVSAGVAAAPVSAPMPAPPVPMTSAAARFVVEPPPPIIKPRQDTAAPKPAEKRPEQIFTF